MHLHHTRTHKRLQPHRVAVFATAAIIALVGALAAAPPAALAVGTESPGDIPGTLGDLVIHKHAGAPGAAGNGQEITDTDPLGIGLQGVEFTVARVSANGVPIDLTKAAGWDLAKGATLPLGGNYGSTPIPNGPIVTDASGVGSVRGLPFGLYLVTETSAGPNAVSELAQPFLVTLPYPNASSDGWLTQVHVYPKNQLADQASLSVSAPEYPTLGETVTWAIAAPVPRPSSGQRTTSFVISDRLDARLELRSVAVSRGGVPLTRDVDYSVGEPTPQNGNTVTITPTLNAVRTGQVYTVQLATRVAGAGELVNTAVRSLNGADTPIGPAQSNWGALRLIERAQGSNATLRGAEFELYQSDRKTLIVPATETDAHGEIAFPGLWVGSGTKRTEEYCLKATRPPAGYVLPADPWTCVTLTSNSSGTPVEQVVTSVRQQGLVLPLTGAAGTTVMIAGGTALFAVAAAWAFWGGRRRIAGAAR